jgi:pimeloyl-ACP methyl ester carboxylesterase
MPRSSSTQPQAPSLDESIVVPAYGGVHVTPAANRDAILADGLTRRVTRRTQGNFDADPTVLYLTDSVANGHRWAREIANRHGEPGVYAIFAVSLRGYGQPIVSARTPHGPQYVVRHWDVPAANLVHVGDITVKPRRAARTTFA